MGLLWLENVKHLVFRLNQRHLTDYFGNKLAPAQDLSQNHPMGDNDTSTAVT